MSNKQKQLSSIEILIEEEINKSPLLNEGVIDWLKKGVQKAGDTWNALKQKMTNAANNFKSFLKKKANEINKYYPKAKQAYDELVNLAKEENAALPTNDKTFQIAQKLPELGKQAIAETQQEVQTVQQAKKQIPNQQQQTQQQQQAVAQESYMVFVTELLNETTKNYNKKTKESIQERVLLKEVDPFGAIGLGLGALGGVPLLIKGLYKLASFLKLQKTSEFLKNVHHVVHNIEEKAVDIMFPDKLSYKWYVSKHGIVTKKETQPLSFEEYKNSKVKNKVERQLYVILLIPFLLHGVSAVTNAGINLVGAAEGAASTVKAVEIGEQVAELAGAVEGAAD